MQVVGLTAKQVWGTSDIVTDNYGERKGEIGDIYICSRTTTTTITSIRQRADGEHKEQKACPHVCTTLRP